MHPNLAFPFQADVHLRSASFLSSKSVYPSLPFCPGVIINRPPLIFNQVPEWMSNYMFTLPLGLSYTQQKIIVKFEDPDILINWDLNLDPPFGGLVLAKFALRKILTSWAPVFPNDKKE